MSRPRTPYMRVYLAQLMVAQGGVCPYCNQELPDPHDRDEHGPLIEIDHRIPVARGGSDDLSNLQALHRACNRMKGAA